MSVRTARLIFWAYVVVGTIALTFPGILPFNRVRPMIFGMPFVLVWVAFWVALAFTVFLLVNRTLDATDDQGGA